MRHRLLRLAARLWPLATDSVPASFTARPDPAKAAPGLARRLCPFLWVDSKGCGSDPAHDSHSSRPVSPPAQRQRDTPHVPAWTLEIHGMNHMRNSMNPMLGWMRKGHDVGGPRKRPSRKSRKKVPGGGLVEAEGQRLLSKPAVFIHHSSTRVHEAASLGKK